jgi:hypothetical protein
MNPKDKAEELVNKYLITTPVGFHIDDAKQCSLIACDEIIEALRFHSWQNRNEIEYYEEVKQEINNYE